MRIIIEGGGISSRSLAVRLSFGRAPRTRSSGRKFPASGLWVTPPPCLKPTSSGPSASGCGSFGYEEGRNVAIEYRWAEGHYARFPAQVAELLAAKVDVIVTAGTPASLAVKKIDDGPAGLCDQRDSTAATSGAIHHGARSPRPKRIVAITKALNPLWISPDRMEPGGLIGAPGRLASLLSLLGLR